MTTARDDLIETKHNEKTQSKIYYPCRTKLMIYLGIMFFISTFIHTLLETYKEIIMLTKQTPSSIYFIKLFLTLPMSFLITLILQKAFDKHNLSSIYKFGIILYVLFFLLFGLLALPYEQHIQKGSMWVCDILGDGKLKTRGLNFLEPLLYIYGQWIYTVFYVVAELWGSFMISYFFYLFTNSLCTKTEMESILTYLSSISALSMIISAGLYAIFTLAKQTLSYSSSVLAHSVLFLTMGGLTILINVIKMYLECIYKKENEDIIMKTKKTQGMDSIAGMFRSNVLTSMAVVSCMYAFNSALIEAIFKNGLFDGARINNVDAEEYSTKFISWMVIFLSIYILIITLCLTNWLKHKGWFFISIVSPCFSLISSTIISILTFYNFPTKTQKGLFLNSFLESKPKFLDTENWITMLSCAISKGNKYVLFDVAKEKISMRISDHYRRKYKSIYDGICFRLGKSAASLYGAALTIFGVTNLRQVAPLSLLILITTNYVWIRAVRYINGKYLVSLEKNCDIDLEFEEDKEEECLHA